MRLHAWLSLSCWPAPRPGCDSRWLNANAADCRRFRCIRTRPLRLLAGSEADLVDVLGLERGEEALHGRVIEAVAAAAHGLRDAVPLQHRPVGLGGVLHAAVAVVDQPA